MTINDEIMAIISSVMSKYPDLRFMQVLYLLDITKVSFYEAPEKTLTRIKVALDKFPSYTNIKKGGNNG